MSGPMPRSVAFRREREQGWRRLEELCQQIERSGITSLRDHELTELPNLHRSAVSALSVARAISLDRALLEYLEYLTARSHMCVYARRCELWPGFTRFFVRSFPGAVREARWYLALAALLLVLGASTAFAVTMRDPDMYHAFVSPEIAQGRDPSTTTEELREGLYSDIDASEGLTLFATFLFQHNTQVGILCFALGFAIGLPVLWLLFHTGLFLGGLSALHHQHGLSLDWWSWILPHGVTELLAVLLCGAAGLLQGRAVLLPGQKTRIAALRDAGRRAGTIVLGCVLLFFLAALLEGFFRQLVHSVTVRYTVAITSALAWLAYFAFSGRSER